MSIKTVTNKQGKTKYQAQLWHMGQFYGSKMFDTKVLAKSWHDAQLKKIARGELLPAHERRIQREAEAGLDESMEVWSQRYLSGPGATHSVSRRYDYQLVGSLLADTPLRAFSGRNGSLLVERLSRAWKCDRRPRRKHAAGQAEAHTAARPLGSNSVRLRLSALMRLLRFARQSLPPAAVFEMPRLKEDLFEFKMPAAHGAPRKRIPSDDEYASLLIELERHPAVRDLLEVMDDIGCRLSEIRTAQASQLHLLYEGEALVGGVLTLSQHKTLEDVGERLIPLSEHAARVLGMRSARQADGALFPGLTKDQALDRFGSACKRADIEALQYKDFRRGFINRAKGQVPDLDMMKMGLLPAGTDRGDLSEASRLVLKVVGHTRVSTTVGYTMLELRSLCAALTRVSRRQRVQSIIDDRLAKALPATESSDGGGNQCGVAIGQLPAPTSDTGEVHSLEARQRELMREAERLEAEIRRLRRAT